METHRSCFRSCGARQFVRSRRLLQHPLLAVAGVMMGAGAAKSGQGAWVVGGILSSVALYFGVLVTAAATRSGFRANTTVPELRPLLGVCDPK